MRKFNTRRIADPLRMRSESIQNQQSIYHSYPGNTYKSRPDPLNQFHESLVKKESFLLNLKQSKNKTLGIEGDERQMVSKIQNSIKDTNKQIRLLRHEWSQTKTQSQERNNAKLDKFIDRLKDSLNNSRNDRTPSPPQQIMYPIPMPFPIYNYPQRPYSKKDHLRDQPTRQSFRGSTRNDSYYLQSNKIYKRQTRAQRVMRNLKRWRKVSNSILFTIYLRKFCVLARKDRLIKFKQLQPKLRSMLDAASQSIAKSLFSFFRVLIEKREVSFGIEEDEEKDLKKQKVASIRKLLMMVLEGVKRWTILACKNQSIVAMLYHLCRHGNYSCTEPIMTRQELELVCISTKNKYVSADSNLEAAAYINTVFVKLLVFNVLLSPGKISSQLQQPTIVENLQVIASIVYEFVLDIQDSYLMAVPKSYQIGNFEGLDWVKTAHSLIYNHASPQPGELISGLKSENWVKKHFKMGGWGEEKGMLTSTIGIFHQMMAAFHKKTTKDLI